MLKQVRPVTATEVTLVGKALAIAPADVGQLVPTASVAGESEVLLMVMVADGGSTVF